MSESSVIVANLGCRVCKFVASKSCLICGVLSYELGRVPYVLCAWSRSWPKLAKAVTVWRKVKILEVAIVEMPAISFAKRKGSALLCLSMYEGYRAEVT